MPIGHSCYIQPISPTATSDGGDEDGSVSQKAKYIYIFYDFETQQSLSVFGDEGKKIYVVNLCVAHKICSVFFNDKDTISHRCLTCGIQEDVFEIKPV